MRILHIWDQAGVACILAKYQEQLGHKVKVLRISNYDPYGIYNFYKKYVSYANESNFYQLCLKESLNADIIHIHSRIDILFLLKQRIMEAKFIMHYHGSELRGLKKNSVFSRPLFDIPKYMIKEFKNSRTLHKKNKHAQYLANAVLVSTPDLMKYVIKDNAEFLHNPVDTDHFNGDGYDSNNNSFFTFNTESTSEIAWIINFCKKNGIANLKVIDRTKNPVSYGDMPSLLKKFGVYVDIRYVNFRILQNLSKTALESLSCGLKVLDYTLNIRKGLPKEHMPDNVIARLEKIYERTV